MKQHLPHIRVLHSQFMCTCQARLQQQRILAPWPSTSKRPVAKALRRSERWHSRVGYTAKAVDVTMDAGEYRMEDPYETFMGSPMQSHASAVRSVGSC